MVYCAYCGNQFTRKEHLERHLPTHTNVKPYRCAHCQLDFSRRDMLQRHYSQYHEEKGPMERTAAGSHTRGGQTQIACNHCAQAKTGCDKLLPSCTRCLEKNLVCQTRFARRQTKNAARVAATAAAKKQVTQPMPKVVAPAMMTINHGGSMVQDDIPQMEPTVSTMGEYLMDSQIVQMSSPPGHMMPFNPSIYHENFPSYDDNFTAFTSNFMGNDGYGINGAAALETMGPSYSDIPWQMGVDFDVANTNTVSTVNTASSVNTVNTANTITDGNNISDNNNNTSGNNNIGDNSNSDNSFSAWDFTSATLGDNGLPAQRLADEPSPGSTPADKRRRISRSTHVGSRSTSVTSTQSAPAPNDASIKGSDIMAASEAGWPLAQCTAVVYSGDCPQTAIIHLENLERMSQYASTWHALEADIRSAARGDDVGINNNNNQEAESSSTTRRDDVGAVQNNNNNNQEATTVPASSSPFPSFASPSFSPSSSSSLSSSVVVPMRPQTRDQLIAITQTSLHKALDIHRRVLYAQAEPSALFPYIVLPPLDVLDYFVQEYVRTLSLFYSLAPNRFIDPNVMVGQSQASNLLLLFMIAQGASVVPSEEARALSIGLIEICRLSLFDIIEKNVALCSDPTVHRCALLFTLLGVWSGDKWLMDIAMGQRSMYTAMLLHAGMFASPVPISIRSPDARDFRLFWLEQETKNRLVYNWVIVDQEISLFHDIAPTLFTGQLRAPLPGLEELWLAGDSEEKWLDVWHGLPNTPRQEALSQLPSLCDLFAQFTNSAAVDITPPGGWTAHLLRLLLQPLQLLQWQLREMNLYVGADCHDRKDNSNDNINNPFTGIPNPWPLAQDRILTLYLKWQEIAKAYADAHPSCVATKINFVLYHLLLLNRVSNFPFIESLARDGVHVVGPSSSATVYVHNSRQAMYHCGQVIRLLRGMRLDERPVWCSVAIYRVMMVLWANSFVMAQHDRPRDSHGDVNNTSRDGGVHQPLPDIVIDSATHTSFDSMWAAPGNPVLMGSGNGAPPVRLDNPTSILLHAVTLLESCSHSRLNDGIKRKLATMRTNWRCRSSWTVFRQRV